MQVAFFKRLRKLRPGLFAVVAIPTLAVSAYFAFFASDVYVSESQFVVRTPNSQQPTGIGSLLQSAGFGKSGDDSHTVRDYILSRDALRSLISQLRLDQAYRSPEVDLVSRFGGIDPDDSFEALHRYYRRKVDVQLDTNSSVLTLSVRAFSAKDAYAANKLLLEKSEELVNRLNDRGRADLLKQAQAEVAIAERRAQAAAAAVSGYRNTAQVVDPEREAARKLEQMSKLYEALVTTEAQLSQLQKFTPENPQIPSVQNRVRIIRAEIAKESAGVTGGRASLTNKAANFHRLTLEADFAGKQLASALAGLELARTDAQRKQVYLERVAQPSLPDMAQEPRRVRDVIATILLGLAAWGILTMLLAGLREHQD